MAGRKRKRGRPRAVRRARIRVARRQESGIDQHALALALIDFCRRIKAEEAKLERKPGETPRKDQ